MEELHGLLDDDASSVSTDESDEDALRTAPRVHYREEHRVARRQSDYSRRIYDSAGEEIYTSEEE